MKIGVVAPDGRGEPIADAITAAGGDPVTDTAGVDALVTVGEAALLSLVTAGSPGPVLPVGAAPGIPSVSHDDVRVAIEQLVAGDAREQAVPLLEATVGDRAVRALRDVLLVTTEPARISEYAIDSAGERVAEFRADGVVVATSAGSHGYARAAGGPVVAASDLVSVVPVSPFAIDMDQWVLPMADLSLSVVRDEAQVELLADTRREMVVQPATTVRLARDGSVSIAVVAESRTSSPGLRVQ